MADKHLSGPDSSPEAASVVAENVGFGFCFCVFGRKRVADLFTWDQAIIAVQAGMMCERKKEMAQISIGRC